MKVTTILFAVLILAVSALWMHSYYQGYWVITSREMMDDRECVRSSWRINSGTGSLLVQRQIRIANAPAVKKLNHKVRPDRWYQVVRPLKPGNPYRSLMSPATVPHNHLYGSFGFALSILQEGTNWQVLREKGHTVSVVFPYWSVTAFFSLCATFPLYRWHRRRRRRANGLCPKCGYDLRETKDRCPECGTPILPAPSDRPTA